LAPRKFYRLNQYITAPKLRVVDEEGKQLGILSLKEALKKAQEKEADLVEIAPQAQPPVAKIIDFKKFQYLEKKKNKKSQKGRQQETKEFRVRPFISDNDLNFRLKRAQQFLKKGHQVRLVVNFRGRELGQKESGYQLIEKFEKGIADYGQRSREPKMMGRSLMVIFEPKKNV